MSNDQNTYESTDPQKIDEMHNLAEEIIQYVNKLIQTRKIPKDIMLCTLNHVYFSCILSMLIPSMRISALKAYYEGNLKAIEEENNND